MQRGATLCLVALLLVGCGAPVVQHPVGEVAVIYADMKELYGALRADLVRACSGPSRRLDAETCGRLAAAQAKLAEIDQGIRLSIQNPTRPVDWAKVSEYTQLLLRAGLTAGTGGAGGLGGLLLP